MRSCRTRVFTHASRLVAGCNCFRILLALLVVTGVSSTSVFAQSTRLPGAGTVRETPPQVLDGSATLVQHYNSNQMLRLAIGLQPPHPDEERQFLEEIAKKDSPEFHHFLTAEEWSQRFGPSADDEQAVVDWAKSQGLNVTNRFPNRLIVDIEAPVSTIEKAFGLTINQYQLGAKSFFSSDRDPVIPSHLTNVVQSVGGLNSLQVLRPAGKNVKEPEFTVYSAGAPRSSGLAGNHNGDQAKFATAMRASQLKKNSSVRPPITNGAYDPTDIFSSQAYDTNGLYRFGHCCNPLHNPSVTPPQTSIAIATAGTQNGSDFTGFHNQYSYLADHWQQFFIDGTPACCDGEGTMDMEWSTAMSNSFGSFVDTAMVYMYDGVNANFSTFNDIWNHMLSDNLARTMSTSWGCQELGCYDSGDMNTADSIFSSMIGQGWTLVAASGDQGAAAGCGAATAVQFPSSDPNVVAAGGTTLSLFGGPVFSSEVAWSGGPDGCGTNDGGSTGGFSSFFGTPGYQSSLGLGSRGLPDVALNADWFNTPQNIFFGGSLQGNGGTSIVAPEMAGFFANEESYLLYLSTQISGGLCNGHGCGPLGNGNWYLYWFGENPSYAPHYPFYDITSGCNNNDVTAFFGLTFFCAGSGWDAVTGWGSVNMMQLAWAINTYNAGDFVAPSVFFSGPSINTWYNSDQIVSWSVFDNGTSSLPAVGVSGFSQAWDADPGDVSREATPGSGNSFYSGPQYPNATTGCLDLTGASCAGSVGQGWHTVNVRAWDNSGFTSHYTYGPIGFDTISPVTKATLTGTFNGSVYTTPVKVTLSASDAAPGSGVSHTFRDLNGSPYVAYAAPFTVTKTGPNNVSMYSTDAAGNVESAHTVAFTIEAATTTTLTSSVNPSTFGQSVTFKAAVAGSFGPAPIGTVTFMNGAAVLGTASLAGGVATFTTNALTVGVHNMKAVYGGWAGNFASTSAILKQTVVKAATTTTLVSSANPSTHGKPVIFTATVKGAFGGTVAGTVQFYDGTTLLASAAVNATTHQAKFTTSALAVGTHKIKAVYVGNVNNLTSTSTVLSQVVK